MDKDPQIAPWHTKPHVVVMLPMLCEKALTVIRKRNDVHTVAEKPQRALRLPRQWLRGHRPPTQRGGALWPWRGPPGQRGREYITQIQSTICNKTILKVNKIALDSSSSTFLPFKDTAHRDVDRTALEISHNLYMVLDTFLPLLSWSDIIEKTNCVCFVRS